MPAISQTLTQPAYTCAARTVLRPDPAGKDRDGIRGRRQIQLPVVAAVIHPSDHEAMLTPHARDCHGSLHLRQRWPQPVVLERATAGCPRSFRNMQVRVGCLPSGKARTAGVLLSRTSTSLTRLWPDPAGGRCRQPGAAPRVQHQAAGQSPRSPSLPKMLVRCGASSCRDPWRMGW